MCGFLEDGFEELAALYLNHFDEAAVNEGKKNRCDRLQVRTLQAQQCLRWLYLHRFLQSEKNGKKIYEAMVPAVTEILTQMNRLHQVLSETLDEKERKNLQHTISILCAEYCGMYGVGEYLLGLAAQTDQELYLDAMDQAAGNGITLAAEEMMRSYFYGRRGCEVQPGYAKFYSRLVSLRHVASSISDAVEGVEGLEMLVPGAEA